MWEPVGPLPAAVYWRRRAAALASAVVLVGLVFTTAAPPSVRPVPAANRTAATVASSEPPAPGVRPATSYGAVYAAEGARDGADEATTAAPSPAGRPSDILSRATGGATPSVAPSAIPSPSPTTGTTTGTAAPVDTPAPGPSTGPERIRPDDTRRPSAAAQQVPVPATGPAPCTNAMLSAAAELDHAVHRVGSHPVLRLVVTNESGQPCVRDLDAARQEIVVWSADGRGRLWSSNDCGNASTIDLRTLVPGRPVAFAVTWGERTSAPGCRAPRTSVPAGTYRLMVRLDNLISPPTPFIRTP